MAPQAAPVRNGPGGGFLRGASSAMIYGEIAAALIACALLWATLNLDLLLGKKRK